MESGRKLQSRWGGTLEDGFVLLPVRLLRLQQKLNIDCTELVVLINLLSMWHDEDRPVWRAVGMIAENIGISTRTVQRAISGLEAKKIIAQENSADGKVIHLQKVRQILESDG